MYITCSNVKTFDCIWIDVNMIFHPFISSCTYISLHLPLVCIAFTNYSPLSPSQRFLLHLSFSFRYLKPHVWIVTMCVSEDYSGSSVRLLRNFTATRIGGTDRQAHVLVQRSLVRRQKKDAVSKRSAHVIILNIFISRSCEVTAPETTETNVSEKHQSLSQCPFYVPWENTAPSFISYVQPLSCWGIRKSKITQCWGGKHLEVE